MPFTACACSQLDIDHKNRQKCFGNRFWANSHTYHILANGHKFLKSSPPQNPWKTRCSNCLGLRGRHAILSPLFPRAQRKQMKLGAKCWRRKMLEIIKCYVALSVCVCESIWFAARRHKSYTPMPSRVTSVESAGSWGKSEGRNHVNAIFTFYDNNVIPFFAKIVNN